MSKGIRILATAMLFFVIMCGASLAAEHEADLYHKMYEDHYTISELTSDYKTSYDPQSTRFGGFDLHIHTPNGYKLAAGDGFTITPKSEVFIGYVKSSDFFGPIGNVEDHLCFKMPYLKQNDLLSQIRTSSPVTHKLVSYEYESNSISPYTSEMPLNDAGNMPIFGALGDVATQQALSEATYTIKLGNDTYNGKLGKVVTTEEQIRNTAVPYIELEVDENGKVQSILWRGVKASDPSTAVVYTNENDPSMGMLVPYLKKHIYLKDGSTVGTEHSTGNMSAWPRTGEKLEETWNAPFFHESDSSKPYNLYVKDISTIHIENDDDFHWVFYPKQQGGGGGSTNITPGDVSYTPTTGVTDVSCDGTNRPTPAGFDKAAMSDSSTITNITAINTIQLTVNYDRRTIVQGATVTFTISNFSYSAKGKLYACAKNKNGVWDRFPITMTAGGISFTLPVLAYFSTSDIVIADIETGNNDNSGGSGGGGCVTGAALFAVAAVALMKRKK